MPDSCRFLGIVSWLQCCLQPCQEAGGRVCDVSMAHKLFFSYLFSPILACTRWGYLRRKLCACVCVWSANDSQSCSFCWSSGGFECWQHTLRVCFYSLFHPSYSSPLVATFIHAPNLPPPPPPPPDSIQSSQQTQLHMIPPGTFPVASSGSFDLVPIRRATPVRPWAGR